MFVSIPVPGREALDGSPHLSSVQDGVERAAGDAFRHHLARQPFLASFARSWSILRRFSGLLAYSFAFSASSRPLGPRASSASLLVNDAISVLLKVLSLIHISEPT